jgi:arylsulfatase A-like enzyme
MDTVRAENVSGYGEADTTPHLMKIAEQGVLFRDFYGASTYTIPSHMSIFTGLDPYEHQVASKTARLAPEVPTLAEHLQKAGWKTKAFQEGGYIAGRFGFERGFEEYDEFERIEVVDSAFPEVLDWVEQAGDDPYFLFLHTYCAHYPFGGMKRYREAHPERKLPTKKQLLRTYKRTEEAGGKLSPDKRADFALYNYFVDKQDDRIGVGGTYNQLGARFRDSEHYELDRAQILESYDERIGMVDEALGKLRAKLEELGQWEDTLLVVFSDHGEAFFEHGLERHDYVPFNEVLKVPLVVSYPRLTAGREGFEVDGLAWHLDLFPTVLRLAGVDVPDVKEEAWDLTRVIQGAETIDAERVVYPAVLRPAFRPQLPLARVAIQGDYKRIAGHEFFGDTKGLLFHLAEDPGELENLRVELPGVFDRLGYLADAYESRLTRTLPVHQETGERLSGDPEKDSELELSEETQRKLLDLGYAGDE